MKSIYLFTLFFILSSYIMAQKSNDINQSIIAQAEFSDDGDLTLSWLPKEGSEKYNILSRSDLEGNWEVETTDLQDTFYIIDDYPGGVIEYLIESTGTNYATTHILAGSKYFSPDQQERMLILAMDNIYDGLIETIENYRSVLETELITSELVHIDSSMEVTDVKQLITDLHDEESIDYILILGHVPVPYSGNSAIDGHGNHNGAWVADGFYGDMDGNWTDSFVTDTSASRQANHNVPGDGKFDQIIFPSDVEIPVGRVDFSDLPKLLQSEIELTRRYLERNIAYRTGQFKVAERAIIDNNFNLAEGFAQGAIKSFHTFLDPDSISYGQFSQCTSQDYLFAYGAGGGNYQGASGIISTNNLVTDSIQSVFTTIFGSYFGDWDVTNNLLRASLARGTSLINAWSGRPIWYFHYMSMGQTVGQVLLNTQNNNGNYLSQFGKRYCHISLLGDPSLKMYYEKTVADLQIVGDVLSWDSSSENNEELGYTIYTKEDLGQWQLYGEGPIFSKSVFISDLADAGMVEIMVRPVRLIENRSGSYYNEGSGVILEHIISNTKDIATDLILFPNPATDFIELQDIEVREPIKIMNSEGRKMLLWNAGPKINISSLAPGMYFLQYKQEVFRFVKE